MSDVDTPPREVMSAPRNARVRRLLSYAGLMKALLLTREYPPRVYGGAGVVVDQPSRALSRGMSVEVRRFGERPPRRGRYGCAAMSRSG
jgi:hypothetical protein